MAPDASDASDGWLRRARTSQACTFVRNATYLAAHRDESTSELHLYICDEREDGPGSVLAATVDEATGELTPLGSPIAADNRGDSKPGACCFVSVAPGGRHVVAANYLGGSLVAMARAPDGSLDAASVQYVHLPPAEHPVAYPRPNAARQEGPHAHMALFSSGRDGVHLLVPDLGSDVVWSVRYDASSASQPLGVPQPTGVDASLAGGGPRHAALHPTLPLAYVGYELVSLVAAFAVNPASGALVPDLPPRRVWNVLDGTEGPLLRGAGARSAELDALRGAGAGGHAVCSDKQTSIAAVRVTPDGTHLLVSSRLVGAPGALTAIPLGADGALDVSKTRVTRTLGRTPRDFALLPPPPPTEGGERTAKRHKAAEAAEAPLALLVANQDDDTLVALAAGQEGVVVGEAPTPVCLCVAP